VASIPLFPSHKHCKHCNQTKPLEDFGVARRGKYGRAAECCACHNARTRVYNAENPEKLRARNANLTEEQREAKRVREKKNYHENSSKKAKHCPPRIRSTRKPRCIQKREKTPRDIEYERERAHQQYLLRAEKIRIYNRERYALNPEKFKARMLNQYHSNPDYQQKTLERSRNRTRNPEKARAAKNRRRTRLAGNGGYFTDKDVANMRYIQQNLCAYCGRIGQTLQIEHIIPVCRGGPSDPWNLCLACRKCNLNKGRKLLSEWKQRWYLVRQSP
jgi:hypothetical protein